MKLVCVLECLVVIVWFVFLLLSIRVNLLFRMVLLWVGSFFEKVVMLVVMLLMIMILEWLVGCVGVILFLIFFDSMWVGGFDNVWLLLLY